MVRTLGPPTFSYRRFGYTIAASVFMARFPRAITTGVSTPNTFRAFHNEGFRRLWPANGLSYTARWMQMTMLSLLVLDMTDSPWMVALVGFFGMAPLLVLSLVGGVLADRLNRQRLYAITQTANLFASIAITVVLFLGWVQVWHAYITVLVTGTTWALDFPARRSLIQDLLGRDGVTNGIALDSVAMHGSRMVGPALAGGLMTWIDVSGGYIVVSAFYVVSAMFLWFLRVPARKAILHDGTTPLRNLVEGLRYVMRNQTIRATVIVTVLMNFLFFSYMQMVPVIARDTLGVGTGLTGVLMSADGMGAFLGAFVIASMVRIRYHGRIYIWGSMLALALLLAFSFSSWYGFSFPIMVLMGLGVAGFATMQSTIVILVAKEEMRGRALGVISLGIGAGPLGALMVGAIADKISPTFAIGVNACIGLVLVGLVWLLIPALRRPVLPDEQEPLKEALGT